MRKNPHTCQEKTYMTNMLIKKIAQKIGDRQTAIGIGIADPFSHGDRDRDRKFL